MIARLEKRLADLEARMRQMVRIGKVTTVYPDRSRVRVRVPDADSLVSYELPVLSQKTQDDKFYALPDVGEQVVCVFLPYGLEQGFVVGAFFSQADTVPVNDQDKYHIRFKDGTTVEYDRRRHQLTVDCVREIVVRAASHVQVLAARIDLN